MGNSVFRCKGTYNQQEFTVSSSLLSFLIFQKHVKIPKKMLVSGDITKTWYISSAFMSIFNNSFVNTLIMVI